MRGRSTLMAVAAMAMASAGIAADVGQRAVVDTRYGRERGTSGQPYRGTAGMAIGSKTRGTKKVQRAATKKRNKARYRAACRG